MSTYDQIKAFYGRHWDTLRLFDLCRLCSNVAMSIATGSAIELDHFDGFMNRKKQIQPVDRIDAANVLCELSQQLLDRAESISQSEIEEIDRFQSLLNAARKTSTDG